jgi:hypothetical protein
MVVGVTDENVFRRNSGGVGDPFLPGVVLADHDDVAFDEHDLGAAVIKDKRANVELVVSVDSLRGRPAHVVADHHDRL